MENRNLKLVKNKKQKKINKAILFLCIAVILGTGIYFLITDFSIQSIEVKGNTTYTDGEIINAIKEQDYVGNTLVMIAQNQVFGQTYLPFIENISMGYDNSHVLKVKVKEKLRAGVFEYMNKNVYFNSEGIALESRNQLFEGVPVVTGVSFDKLVLGKQIPVKGDYFNTIMNITKKSLPTDWKSPRFILKMRMTLPLSRASLRFIWEVPCILTGKCQKFQAFCLLFQRNIKKV